MDRVQEWSSARVRAGRPFSPVAERELHPVLRDLASRLPGSGGGVSVIGEMPGPTGLPDLVAIPITPRLSMRLAFECPPLLAWGDARLAAACSTTQGLSIMALAHRLGADADSTRRRARRLVKSGALVETASGGLRRAEELGPVGRVYALEAKVNDWSAGLGQALRYGSWADASAAVLAQLPRDPSPAIAQASELGLGLALGARWLVRPRVRRLALAHRLWASEHVVAALIGASRVAPVQHGDAV
jgi:hypothetical protein